MDWIWLSVILCVAVFMPRYGLLAFYKDWWRMPSSIWSTAKDRGAMLRPNLLPGY